MLARTSTDKTLRQTMAWTCEDCTFLHDEQSQFNFLTCSICNSPRINQSASDDAGVNKISENIDESKISKQRLYENNNKTVQEEHPYVELIGPFASSDIIMSSVKNMRQKAPIVLRKLGENWKCTKKWNSNSYLSKTCGHSYHIRSFLSEKGNFHLDGTNNPSTILTCSMAQETTMGKFLHEIDHHNEEEDEEEEEWASMYALDENFNKSHPLSFDVPRFPFPLNTEPSDHKKKTNNTHKKKKLDTSQLNQQKATTSKLFTSKEFVNRQLFLSKGRTETQLHRDINDNIYVVSSGVREWILIAPTQPNSSCLVNHVSVLNDVNHKDYAISALFQPNYQSFVTLNEDSIISSSVGAADDAARSGNGTMRHEVGHFKQWTLKPPSMSKSPPVSPRMASSSSSSSIVSDQETGEIQLKEGLEGQQPREKQGIPNHHLEPSSLIAHRIVLHPGDGLFIPAGWWHLVVAQPPYSTAVNWYFSPFHISQLRPPTPPAPDTHSVGSVSGGGGGAPSNQPSNCWCVSSSSSTSSSPTVSLNQVSNHQRSSHDSDPTHLSTINQPPVYGVDVNARQIGHQGEANTVIEKGSVEIVLGGDFLQATDTFLVHQCNCNSVGARGIAKAIFDKWPHVNIYKKRSAGKGKGKGGRGSSSSYSTPGTIDIAKVAQNQIVVGLFSQRFPGLPKSQGDDSKGCRLAWFAECLELLAVDMNQLHEEFAAASSQSSTQQHPPGHHSLFRNSNTATTTTTTAAIATDSDASHARKGNGSRGMITVAMPFLIGCGLAGGDWKDYKSTITDWAVRYGVQVRLYDRDRQSYKFH